MKSIQEQSGIYAMLTDSEEQSFFEIKAFAAGAKFAQQWISIGEELPKEGSIILVRSNSPFKPSTAFYTKGIFRCDFIGLSHEQVSHWRPIELK